MKITLFDTSVCSTNLGDFIIMDAVRDQIESLFPDAMIFNAPTHERISRPTYKILKQTDLSIVGGTNLLSSNMNRYNQWKVGLRDVPFLDDVVLMGVGWWQYQKAPNFFTKFLLRSILSHDKLHSVRDSYTKSMLIAAGIKNVINTGCPTMWKLDGDHCSDIPTNKAQSVVVTLTDYNKNFTYDLGLLKLLNSCYEKVFIWPQGIGDLLYLSQLEANKYGVLLSPSLNSYNHCLKNEESLDYIGTRLHAGVRALQHKRRTIVIGIDNRSLEKSKDFNLTVVPRDNLDELKIKINSHFPTNIYLPNEEINAWKRQL